MRLATQLLIENYELKKLKYDFMGYEFMRMNELSFHHLLIPRCEAPNRGLDRGYYYWNGVILNKNTAHTYLHIIEEYDYDMFLAITSEMLDEKIKEYIDVDNLRRIDDILKCFEKEYIDEERKGHPLIKSTYMKRVLKKE